MPKAPPPFRPHGLQDGQQAGSSQAGGKQARQRRHDARRVSAARRGYGGKWRRERERFLRDHPLCEACAARGIVQEAELVDHIIPHKGDMKLFWKRWNWQALCKSCHDRDKQRAEAAWQAGQVWLASLYLGADDERRSELIAGWKRLTEAKPDH